MHVQMHKWKQGWMGRTSSTLDLERVFTSGRGDFAIGVCMYVCMYPEQGK